jgi:hypothetical protein
MSARKLGRLAGLVFALAAFLGGVAVTAGVAPSTVSAIHAITMETSWG